MTAQEERRIVELARSLEDEARTCLREHPVGGAVLAEGVRTNKRLRTAIDAECLRAALKASIAEGPDPLVAQATLLVQEADALYWSLALQWQPWAWQIILAAGHDESMVQEAMYGLYLGAIRFRPDKGRFSTYARSWLEQIVRRAKQRDALVPRPPYLHELLPRIHKAQRQMPDRTLSAAELARLISSDEHLVKHAMGITANLSLDVPVGDGGATLGDLVSDDSGTGPDEASEATWAKRRAWALVLQLKPREQTVIVMRHGLDGAPELSLQDIATALGVSRERIRQIQATSTEAMLSLPAALMKSSPPVPEDPLDALSAQVRDLVRGIRSGASGLAMP